MLLKKLSLAIALSGLVSGAAYALPSVTVKIIAFNDFHGQLQSPGTLRINPSSSTPATAVGGIDYLASYIADAKSKNPNSIVVSAGDLIGASPLISALFHDEPTIEVMNRAGLDLNAVGNHEFDEGKTELLRMQNGGCHPTDPNSCQGATVGTPVPFEGAKFKFLAANVADRKTGTNLFPAYSIKEFTAKDGSKVKVAFMGLTLKETPTIVTPSGVAGLRFNDEVNTINQLVAQLKSTGVNAFVVLIHQGGTVPTTQSVSSINACDGGLAGSRIKQIVNGLYDTVDLVISGHTHQAYNCLLATRNGTHMIPVTSANSQSRVFTEIDLKLNNPGGEVVGITATNKLVDRTNAAIIPDANILSIVNKYNALVSPIANKVLGSIAGALTTTTSAAGETTMGDVIADAQLEATQAAGFGAAQIAFMNPGGVRAGGLTFPSSAAGEGDGNVTYGEAFAVQPFGNSLVTMTLTGAQIETLLEQQFTGCTNNQPFNRIMAPSAGFSYTWKVSGPACDKVDPTTIKLNGVTIDPATSYRVTVNSFMATGGDNFLVLIQGTNRLGGAVDIDALSDYFKAHSPIAVPSLTRIVSVP